MQRLSFRHILTPDGMLHDRALSVAADGRIVAIEHAGRESVEAADGFLALPGIPNAHSHAFQRALAGHGEVPSGADSFWSWREAMYRLAYAKFLAAQQGLSTTSSGATPRPAVAAAADEKSTGLAMFAHLSVTIGIFIPLFGIIVPLVIWKIKKDKDELTVACAKEALNLEISALLYLLPIAAFFFLGPLAILSVVLMLVIGIVVFIGPIIAAVKAMAGESFRYPFIWHVFE